MITNLSDRMINFSLLFKKTIRMKRSRLFLKVAALSSFALLMTSFVAFRSGAFERFYDTGYEGDKQAHLQEGLHVSEIDSPPANHHVVIPSSKSGTIMPSSKVLIIRPDPTEKSAQDTGKHQQQEQQKAPEQKKNTTGKDKNPSDKNTPNNSGSPSKESKPPSEQKEFMGGSKSKPMFR
jgi:hypothetical protein